MAGDDEDLQLGTLRAAWRALPDEAPPERGLAELMAAARAKAEAMAAASCEVATLAQQCRAAAARGDCQAARELAARVQRADAAGYAELQRDAAVAACLR